MVSFKMYFLITSCELVDGQHLGISNITVMNGLGLFVSRVVGWQERQIETGKVIIYAP